jgi:hypothetical protein
MLLFRSLSVGLLGAVLYFVVAGSPGAQQPCTQLAMEATATVAAARPDVTIVDVARNVEPSTVASLVRLDAAEAIVKVDGRSVTGNIEGGARIASHARGSQRYIDVEIATAHGEPRRVLVLLH